MATEKTNTVHQEHLRQNEKKWSKPLMDAGWSAVPSILIEKQQALGLDPLDMNIILHLLKYWWVADNFPHPSVETIATAVGRSKRTVQKRTATLATLGFIEKIERKYSHNGNQTNMYSFNGLIEKMKPYADEKNTLIAQSAAAEKDRLLRKKPKKPSLVVNNEK